MLVDYLIMGGWTSCQIMVGDITEVAFVLIDDDVDHLELCTSYCWRLKKDLLS